MVKYSDGLEQIAYALGHSGRRQMVTRLCRSSATSSELADLLEIGLPALQKHLAVLREAALITSVKTGRVVTHTLAPSGLEKYDDWLSTRRMFWTNQFDWLNEHLENL